jgi:hypothetical protein
MDQGIERFISNKMKEKSLIVYQNNKIIFEHEGKWLHPLLDFATFLKNHPEYEPANLRIIDKVVGRASAMLTAHMGIKNVHAQLLSSLSIPIFEEHQMSYTYDELIDKLPCKTEALLLNIKSLDEAHKIITNRANKNNNN